MPRRVLRRKWWGRIVDLFIGLSCLGGAVIVLSGCTQLQIASEMINSATRAAKEVNDQQATTNLDLMCEPLPFAGTLRATTPDKFLSLYALCGGSLDDLNRAMKGRGF